MSTFRDSFRGLKPSAGEQSALEIDIRKCWPNLADCLFGVPSADGGEPLMPSCSIVMFIEGDRLKYCLTPQGSTHVAFGTISAPMEGFNGLEASLERGDYAWRAKKGKR